MNPVLHALIESAVDATGAAQGWLVAIDADGLRVVEAHGGTAASVLDRRLPSGDGAVGFVVASGQPLALTPRPDDPRMADELARSVGDRLTSVVCVPCTDDDAVRGALQLVNKAGGGSFSFDDVELATLLAGIAGVALAASGEVAAVPAPAELGADLNRLAAADPAAYVRTATVVRALLDHG